jgi:gas vesicle protein
MTHLHTFLLGCLIGAVAVLLLNRSTDQTPEIERLKQRAKELRKQAERAEIVADSLYIVAQQSKATHIHDTVYITLTKVHHEKIRSILDLDLDGHLREFASWTSEADSIRRRYAGAGRH